VKEKCRQRRDGAHETKQDHHRFAADTIRQGRHQETAQGCTDPQHRHQPAHLHRAEMAILRKEDRQEGPAQDQPAHHAATDEGADANVIIGARINKDFVGKVRVITIMTGVKSPYVLGHDRAESSAPAKEMSDLGIEVWR